MNGARTTKADRAHVVDAVRGVAVLAMIAWHSADAWLAPPHRETFGFRLALIVGGLAAPLFLLLAGVAAALVEPAQHTAATRAAALRRALQIAVLGYALKLFALAIDRGGAIGDDALGVWLGALGLGALHLACGDLSPLPPTRRTGAARWALGISGAAGWTLGVLLVQDERSAELMVRLDVLQGIGAALAVLALVMPATARNRPVATLVVLALVVTLATPPIAALELRPSSPLVAGLLDYVARLTPYPAPTSARFPLFPWVAYTLLGAALGRAMRGRPIAAPFGLPAPLRAPWVLVLGIVAAIASFEAGPLPQLLLAPGELVRNLVRLVFNTAMAFAFAGAIATFLGGGPLPARGMALLGRHSLLVYAVHLEIVYGLPTVPLVRALSFPWWAALAALLTLAMALLAHRVEQRDRTRRANQFAAHLQA